MELKLLPKGTNSEDFSSSAESNPMVAPQVAGPFRITPQELTGIVNKYKERDENMQDIKYFDEQGGIDNLLKELNTDKSKGLCS